LTPFAYFQKFRDRFFNIRQRLRGFPKIHQTFLRVHGYALDLKDPKTNNQRLVHKMITDRNPLIPITSDKVRVRDYVREKLGKALAEEILIPVYHISKTGRDIPNDQWDTEFFLKANHGSKSNKIIPAGEDPQIVSELAVQWLNQSYGQAMHEWAYRDIPRRIICEQVLRDETGNIPMDIKYYCFNGKCKLIFFYKDRFGEPARIFSDENRNPIHGFQSVGYRMLEEVPKLSTHSRMLELAEKLSQGFQYCRVDFYSMEDKVYFGELTHYTGAGLEKLDSYEIDLALGRLWLPENQGKSLPQSFQEVLEEAALPTQ
jgi:hypothetical protein